MLVRLMIRTSKFLYLFSSICFLFDLGLVILSWKYGDNFQFHKEAKLDISFDPNRVWWIGFACLMAAFLIRIRIKTRRENDVRIFKIYWIG